MQQRELGALGPTSILTLGGGGLGQLWGETTREECVACVHEAVEAGINLLDMAPGYGNGEAERVIGEAFGGSMPQGVRITTKCRVGQTPPAEVPGLLRETLAGSLERMKLSSVDVFFLHSNIVPDNDPMSDTPDGPVRLTPLSVYREQVRPTFEALKAEGLIRHWGITGIGHPDTIMEVLAGEEPTPAIVQCIANALDSAGSLAYTPGPRKPRDIAALAQAYGVGVMGIRAVQAGALTDQIDRPLPPDHGEVRDYNRAEGFRALAKEMGVSAAELGHRYALSMPNVDTVVLGIKNRTELRACLAMADAGPLSTEEIARVDASFG